MPSHPEAYPGSSRAQGLQKGLHTFCFALELRAVRRPHCWPKHNWYLHWAPRVFGHLPLMPMSPKYGDTGAAESPVKDELARASSAEPGERNFMLASRRAGRATGLEGLRLGGCGAPAVFAFSGLGYVRILKTSSPSSVEPKPQTTPQPYRASTPGGCRVSRPLNLPEPWDVSPPSNSPQ